MRTRRQSIMVLMVLLMPALLWSAQESRAERRRAESQATSPDTVPESAREIRIFPLRYQKADGLSRIIMALIPLNEATIAVDGVSQRLIVAAAPDLLEQTERLIRELDVNPADDVDVAQMLYRIYMLELPPEHGDLKPFSMLLERSSQLPPEDLLDAVGYADTQIGTFSQQATMGQTWELVLEGRAASNESIKRMLEKIPDSRMKELMWENETLMPPAAEATELPEQLRKHIVKLLGQKVQAVGYWFGNLSIPGTVEAPIGPWAFQMEVEGSPRENEVELTITVVQESKAEPDSRWQILSNRVRGRLNSPVIIGYNRERYGTRTMGAVVIVPEVSPLP